VALKRLHRHRAVFLDKDGTLVENVPYNVDPDRIRLNPGAGAGLSMLHRAGFRQVVITNQSGVARGMFAEEALGPVEHQLRLLLAREGVPLAGFYYCPHHPESSDRRFAVDCTCRKPQPGLLRRAAEELRIDLAASWMIGDILDDIEAGRAAGCGTILLDNGFETEWQLSPQRMPDMLAEDLHHAASMILRGTRLEVG
jgi:D-glycero-D-manno-heptose 1,7-bisphosphate phosphatase